MKITYGIEDIEIELDIQSRGLPDEIILTKGSYPYKWIYKKVETQHRND
jgi:hypothetical protein